MQGLKAWLGTQLCYWPNRVASEAETESGEGIDGFVLVWRGWLGWSEK